VKKVREKSRGGEKKNGHIRPTGETTRKKNDNLWGKRMLNLEKLKRKGEGFGAASIKVLGLFGVVSKWGGEGHINEPERSNTKKKESINKEDVPRIKRTFNRKKKEKHLLREGSE